MAIRKIKSGKTARPDNKPAIALKYMERSSNVEKTGKTSQIAMEMRRYNTAVLRISETHWTQAGQKRLAKGEMLLYSGHEENNAPHTHGVALMLSKVARNALVGCESHGSRIIKGRDLNEYYPMLCTYK
ncbi:unnamed protein product [Schistosoma margrebowiei]|uniref:Uncharacterized protein n=1 Tax=Schistosoma margrebowiei TaxID=48269 RepID=A0A183MP97_9TREM|nr:unnamed protein product [Schistosoma margrebowiei]